MKKTLTTRFNIGDKVIYQDAYETPKKIFTIRDIILEGSINCLSTNYIIQCKDDVRYVFDSELLLAKKR